ncbi:pentapeptide repeat-containing protein [Actinomadura napierensis]|uniref:Pentapeptide repeat-containing protein n=1 Tax=Actinomadura napierensis TaxID=267854 RepID=A0ABP5M710_9ACTN
MAAAGIVAGAAIWFTTGWLLHTTGQVMDRDPKATGADKAKVRVDTVRTGLAAGAGAGAAVGLMLAFRRQAHAEHDTAERRITELYNAAAEQLGSDKAPVRLTALYTLERLANDNPRHRQTIVNIVCAYLRMPWTPPASEASPTDQQRAATRRFHAARAGASSAVSSPPTSEPDPHEERQVRLTAQRILMTHLQPDAAPYWSGIDLDLSDATLTLFTLARCRLSGANFSGATFSRGASFRQARFLGSASFERATFSGHVSFEAEFCGGASFIDMKVNGHALFDEAIFGDETWFYRMEVGGTASWQGARFGGDTWFHQARFNGDAWFRRVEFSHKAVFEGTIFGGQADFRDARVGGDLDLTGTRLADRTLAHVLPLGWQIEPSEGNTGRFARPPAPANGT